MSSFTTVTVQHSSYPKISTILLHQVRNMGNQNPLNFTQGSSAERQGQNPLNFTQGSLPNGPCRSVASTWVVRGCRPAWQRLNGRGRSAEESVPEFQVLGPATVFSGDSPHNNNHLMRLTICNSLWARCQPFISLMRP
jgi:hypothetical protein